MICNLNPSRNQTFFSSPKCPDGSGAYLAPCSVGYWHSFQGQVLDSWTVKLTIHLHPGAKFKNEGAVRSFPVVCLHGIDKDSFIFTM